LDALPERKSRTKIKSVRGKMSGVIFPQNSAPMRYFGAVAHFITKQTRQPPFLARLSAKNTRQPLSTQKNKKFESEPGVLQSTYSIEHKALMYTWPQRDLKPHRQANHKSTSATKVIKDQAHPI